jgi:hypothetical protein
MKHLVLVFFLLGFSAMAQADPLSEEVVRTLITAAHKDQLQRFLATTDLARIAAQPRHGLSPEKLLILLKTIPVQALTLEVHRSDAKITVRTVGTVRLDFVLEFREKEAGRSEGNFVVVAILPLAGLGEEPAKKGEDNIRAEMMDRNRR